MGFLSQLFSGIDDLGRNDMAAFDDLARFDGHGFEDRAEGNLFTFNENPSVSAIGMPLLDYFTFGLGSTAVKSEYNKKKYGTSGFNAGDFAKSYGSNYLANMMFPGSSGGAYTLGDVAGEIGQGALRGGTAAAIQGGNVSQGAQSGALQGGISGGSSYARNYSSGTAPAANTSAGFLQQYGGQEQTSNPAPWTGEQAGKDYTMFTGTEQSRAPAVVAKSSPYSATYMGDTSPGPASEGPSLDGLGNFLKGLMPQNSERFGDQVSNLMGMYSGYRRYRDARQARREYGTNRDAYVQQLQNKLTAQDAARGRRSNIAGRTTQLQASLAELDSRMLPGMQQLRDAQHSGLDNILRSGYGLGNAMGYWGRQPTQGFGPTPRMAGAPMQAMFNDVAPVQMPSFNIPNVGNVPRADEMDTRRIPYRG